MVYIGNVSILVNSNLRIKIIFIYLQVDDDTFIFTSNLNKFTASKNSKKPLYYGFKWNFGMQNGYIGMLNNKNLTIIRLI